MNIAQWIVNHAQHSPEKVALYAEDTPITYAQLLSRVSRSARLMQQDWQLQPGERIALLATNHVEQVVLLFACAQLGAILVPLNWRLAEPELAHIINDCAPRFLVHDSAHQAQAKRLAEQAASTCQICPLEGADCLAQQRQKHLPRHLVHPAEHADSDLLIVYTSGTTGAPKGAVLDQAALRCNALMAQHAYDMSANDVVLNFLPLFHVGGLNIQLTPALSLGASVVIQSKFDPDQVFDAIEHYRITLTNSVPTILQALTLHPRWDAAKLDTLRIISVGSTDVPTELIDTVHRRGIPVIQIYGATETAPIALYQRASRAYDTVGSIGFPGFGCAVRLVDPHDGRDVDEGEHGEIWVAGDNVFRRYWRNPEGSDLARVNGWFRTGDVARRDAQGLYWFADRIKHVIISGGENIYPAEIERVLRQQLGVREACVVGRADPRWGEVPVAVVVREDPHLSEATLLASFNGVLARFKHPRQVVFVDALPRNAMAKVVLAQVRQLLEPEPIA